MPSIGHLEIQRTTSEHCTPSIGPMCLCGGSWTINST